MKSNRILLIGSSGKGMTALRQYLEGMDLIISTFDDRDRSKCLEDYVKNASQYNLAVYSGAVSENHPLRKALLNCGVEQLHRFDALNRFLVEQTIVGVSGSHGKTTTSWMLVSILKQFYGNCSWIIGEAQIGENILGYHSPEANHVIVEVDESDGMFYRMRSDHFIITNLTFEHINYYSDRDHLIKCFREYINQYKPMVYATKKLIQELNINYQKSRLIECDYTSTVMVNQSHVNYAAHKIRLPWAQAHMTKNLISALAYINTLKIPACDVQAGTDGFKGVKYRFELIKQSSKRRVLLINDYGHHPNEIQANLSYLMKEYRDAKMCVLFEPHRQDRFEYFKESYKQVFASLDQLYIFPIFGSSVIEGSYSIEKSLGELNPNIDVYFPNDVATFSINDLFDRVENNTVIISFSAGLLYKHVSSYGEVI